MGLFDSITQPIAGLLGMGGGTDVPDPNIVHLTPEQEKRINDFGADSRKSAQNLYGEQTQGVNDAAQMQFGGSALQGTEQALGGNNMGMAKAIQNKYRSLAGSNIDVMKQQWKQQAELDRANRLQQGHALLNAKKQMDINNYKRLLDAQQRREQARASAIGSIFGAVGAVGGAFAGAALTGGSPWGAMAGMQGGARIGSGLSGGSSSGGQ